MRLREADLDAQVLALFDAIRIEDEKVREWFAMVLRSKTRDSQEQSRTLRDDLQRQLSSILEQQDRLINLRLLEEIDNLTFARKLRELRDREADLKLKIEVAVPFASRNSRLGGEGV